MSYNTFDENLIIHHLKHYLPTQTPLKDFVHHNTLHAFQEKEFFEAIFTASKIFGYQVCFSIYEYRKLFQEGRIRQDVLDRVISKMYGDDNFGLWKEKLLSGNYDSKVEPRIGNLRSLWKKKYKIDLDNLTQPLLFRILCSYLDQGVAIWHFPYENEGILTAIKKIEQGSLSSFFYSKKAKSLLNDPQLSIRSLLEILVGNEAYYEQYLFDQQFSHRGWSGIVNAIEDMPDTLLYKKKIALKELIIIDLLLEIDSLEMNVKSWEPLASGLAEKPIDLFMVVEKTELQQVLEVWQTAFEWSYYDDILKTVQYNRAQQQGENKVKNFQAIFCIDERECSLRRYIETVDAESETFGCPGFFGVEFYFQPFNGKFYEKLCPAPITPKYLIKEVHNGPKRGSVSIYNKRTHTFFRGIASSIALGGMAAYKLVNDIFNPKMSPAISDAFAHMNIDGELTIENQHLDEIENGLQIGFTVPEMAIRVENLLRGIGLVKDFANMVYIVAHGSSSANNPHHGAHDCGACSGRPGSVNARVFATMANHKEVRKLLIAKDIYIPEATQFIGALHDTAADEIAFFDTKFLNVENSKNHARNLEIFENALDLNARERSRRFASINIHKDIKHVREAIKKRSVSFFEPRPELGHGTNALCFVGTRSMTKNIFLDRRAFLNSYNYKLDPEGEYLLSVLRPLPPVCGGINLEYYFSRIDNYKLGAGTKLPHNVMGLIGVANSSDGDLRPGLPLQMIEVHDPVRLMIIVEHYPEVIKKVLDADDILSDWFKKGWVHLMSIHPDTNDYYYFEENNFCLYKPLTVDIRTTENLFELIKSYKEMETNHIVDATKENIPVHIIKH